MTDYNDGNIHGWNGGDCPVHPKTVVKIWLRQGGQGENQANYYTWSHFGYVGDIVAFQVTKEYKGPKVYTGECWAYHFPSTTPDLTSCDVDGQGVGRGKYTATHQDGKLMKVVWERIDDQ